MNLQFRKMVNEDIAAVYKIECDLFRDPWSFESFLRDVNDERIAHTFVLTSGTEITGYAVCWKYAAEVHIGNIAVARKWQRQGLGGYLLNRVLEYFSDARSSYLEVRESNQAAIHLYKKFGFEILYLRKAYYPDGENALVMVRNEKQRGQDGLV
jgi:[ribosomal protein S18]-alanine N-acetyltransferase